jgi:formylglycine-generating enzyme required for sulfatase activity
VTLQQYRSLTKDAYEIGERWTRDPELPVVRINWYMAAAYCNLLSKEEAIDEDQWCYSVMGEEIALKPNYLHLQGYRLPTEAEMEYVIRAKASTSRYYGETEELLRHYAFYAKNSNDVLQRVGTKKPNDFGFFDVLGNCYTWCLDADADYPQNEGDAVIDLESSAGVVPGTNNRVLRGGSFFNPASYVRSAVRIDYVPTLRVVNVGFRVARTLPR